MLPEPETVKDQWSCGELLKPKCEDPPSETGTRSYTMCCFQTLYDSFYLSHMKVHVWCKSKVLMDTEKLIEVHKC